MSKTIKTWIIIAVSLLVAGCGIFVWMMSELQWDFSKLSTTNYVTNQHELNESFVDISIIGKQADVEFLPTDNEKPLVVCYEDSKALHNVSVKNNALCIALKDERRFYDYIGFNVSDPKITVYLPSKEYGELNLDLSTGSVDIPKDFLFESIVSSQTTGDFHNYASVKGEIKVDITTGDIVVEKVRAQQLSLSTTTGDIVMRSVECFEDSILNIKTGDITLLNVVSKNLTIGGKTGDVLLTDTIVKEKMVTEITTGSIHLGECDAEELFLQTTTGNVEGTLLSEKVFLVKTNTGFVAVPKTVSGGKCEIVTKTGHIIIDLIDSSVL